MAVPMANGPPFATLNHVAADLGIPNESEPLRVGIRSTLWDRNRRMFLWRWIEMLKRIDGIYLKKLLASFLISTALIGGAVAKPDVLERIPGKKSLHHQPTDHQDCVDLLDRLQKGHVILTLRNPTAMGRVTSAYCILPSGSIMKWPADAPTPTPPE